MTRLGRSIALAGLLVSLAGGALAQKWDREEIARQLPEPDDPVEILLAKLSSDHWLVREAAEKFLVDRAGRIEPQLLAAHEKASDPEVRMRLGRAILSGRRQRFSAFLATWQTDLDAARQQAEREKKLLLVVGINGDLGGYT